MREFLRMLPRIRGMPWLVCAAVVGILLLLFSGNGGSQTPLSYSEQLEHRISQMIDTLPGVEEVSVLVTLETAGNGMLSAYSTDAEQTPKIVGIAVTCIGGADAVTRLEILQMLAAAFHLSSDRIWVGGKEAAGQP